MACREREGVDEIVGGGEERVVAIEDGPIGNGSRTMGFAATAAALEDEAAALGGELRGIGGAEQDGAEFRLDGEVEFLKSVQEGEASLTGARTMVALGPERFLRRTYRASQSALAVFPAVPYRTPVVELDPGGRSPREIADVLAALSDTAARSPVWLLLPPLQKPRCEGMAEVAECWKRLSNNERCYVRQGYYEPNDSVI